MSNEIISFDEMAQDTKFTLKGKNYIIPSISNKKAMELFKLGKKVKKAEDTSIDSADLSENAEKEDNDDFVEYQNKFVAASVVHESGDPVTEEEVSDWPMKATMGIVKLINKCISGSVEENSPEEKK